MSTHMSAHMSAERPSLEHSCLHIHIMLQMWFGGHFHYTETTVLCRYFKGHALERLGREGKGHALLRGLVMRAKGHALERLGHEG